ncbi:MAG: DegT/DnrJ/EryC1/StrS family aminotransferase [Candidatus Omnitrophota bacterium]
MIYLSRPCIDYREIRSVVRVLKSGWLSGGEKVKEFENKFAEFIGVKYAISLNSCASALQLAIQAQKLKGEIILPSFTFVASANAVINAGCTPRFADIEYGSCNIDPQKIEALINKKTVAIMPVHYAGQSCDMARILAIARKYGLSVIEDSAESLGARFKNKKTGSFGTGCFSFFSTKNITCGEGGMVTTNSRYVWSKVLAYSSHGVERRSSSKRNPNWLREAKYPGYNYRMANILAAIAVTQLAKIEVMNNQRRELARYLSENLKECGELRLPFEEARCYHVYQMYTIKLRPGYGPKRDLFVDYLRKKGIEASVHFYPPLHKQKLYRGYLYPRDCLPITEEVSSNIVTLPLYPKILKRDLNYIIAKIKEALTRNRG